tara:strand:- start:369 stop:839 length:471 start_codon:yes stop_codon:yes gene_type:complete
LSKTAKNLTVLGKQNYLLETNSGIKLKPVTKNDALFLYDLLKNRDPLTNISHKKMPSYDEHVNFILSNPYTVWYIIEHEGEKIGSIYLSKQDEIGISLIDNSLYDKTGKSIIKSLIKNNPRKRYLAKTSPQNKKLQNFFVNNGFRGLEYTYEMKSN